MGEAQRNQMTKQFGKISLMEVQDPGKPIKGIGGEGQIKGGYLEEVMGTLADELECVS